MPKVCEICGEEATEIVACKRCGIHFCSHCGDIDAELCLDCSEEELEGQEDITEEILEKGMEGYKV